jgi:hypothetical protein
VKGPFRRASLIVAGVVLLAVVTFLIVRAWHANVLATIGAKPIVAILNDTGRSVTDVHLILSGSDFSTKEYRFTLLEPVHEASVTVDTGQEFSLKELTFVVEGVEYQLVGGGPSIGPGEHRVMVVDNGMGVVWRWRPPTAVLRPLRQQAVPRTGGSQVASEHVP